MPLLKKQTLEKAPMPEYLRDDEEVFLCEMTNEIFRDYDEFAERTILCNSMIWTCSMTGKMNLTYEEAQASESNAKKMLQDFPVELKVPMLYVANATSTSSFTEMSEDVYLYIKDRYFVGETVEASFATNKWKEYKVVQVIPPTEDEIKEKRNGDTSLNPQPVLYKYDLEHTNSEDTDITEKLMVDFTQIRRKKSLYSRDKSKLFLKQYVAQNQTGVFIIKPSALKTFDVNETTFAKLFPGPGPVFNKSTKSKKVRQETLAKFLTKNNLLDNTPGEKKKEKVVSVKPVKKVLTADEKQVMRNMLNTKVKEWYQIKDDLILEDHCALPDPLPMISKIPKDLVGDVLYVMEFIDNFSTILEAKNYFSNGLTLDIMEKALIERKVGGPLVSIFEMLLEAIFTCQEDEKKGCKLEMERVSKNERQRIEQTTDIGYEEIIESAIITTGWTRKHHGNALKMLPVCPVTISEMLRLHILTSGVRYIDSHGARIVALNRGGYTSEDDPAIEFRLNNTHILRALTIHNVVELSVRDKLKLLGCLIDQLLTHKSVRDVALERREEAWIMNKSIKQINLAEKKRLEEESKNNKEKVNGDASSEEQRRSMRKSAVETAANQIDDLHNRIYSNTTLIGYDRAFRRYLKLSSVPGIFVNNEDLNSGKCLMNPIYNVPEVSNGDRNTVMKYLKRLTKELNSSDKENEPKDEDEDKTLQNESSNKGTASLKLLNMCSADPTDCVVHSIKHQESPWKVFKDESELTELMNSLNDRGARESELKKQLKSGMKIFNSIVKETPDSIFNVKMEVDDDGGEEDNESPNLDENFGYPYDMSTEDVLCATAVETVNDFEEKLHKNGVGGFSHPERRRFRKLLDDQEFDELLEELEKEDVKKETNGVEEENNDDVSEISEDDEEEEYKDPLDYLKLTSATVDIDDTLCDSDDIVLMLTETEKKRINALAKVIIHLAHSIKPRCLFLPLGNKRRKKEFNSVTKSIMKNWELSLTNATSYAIISMHLATLKNCIGWTSANITCNVCNKKTMQNTMAICDSCSEGLHIFCSRPKIPKVPTGIWYCKKCIEAQPEEEEEPVNYFDYDPYKNPKDCSTCSELESGEVVRCNHCPRVYHLECVQPPIRRVPRTYKCIKCKANEEDESKRYTRFRDESKSDLRLHNVELQEILADVLKHEDAWPFTSPVQKREVPDYYDVISNPMDFGTIRYKLNMGDYKYDDEVLSDMRLVFENCNTYNSSADDVFKCGVKLLKYIIKLLKAVDLKAHILSDIELLDDDNVKEEPKTKKKRTR